MLLARVANTSIEKVLRMRIRRAVSYAMTFPWLYYVIKESDTGKTVEGAVSEARQRVKERYGQIQS
jgi:hypothetical protein